MGEQLGRKRWEIWQSEGYLNTGMLVNLNDLVVRMI